jgi:hypothetical protein
MEVAVIDHPESFDINRVGIALTAGVALLIAALVSYMMR